MHSRQIGRRPERPQTLSLKNRLENTVDHANVCHELAKLRHGRSYVMVRSVIELRNVAGTEAAMGWAGGHTVVIDRPEGKAGDWVSVSMAAKCSL